MPSKPPSTSQTPRTKHIPTSLLSTLSTLPAHNAESWTPILSCPISVSLLIFFEAAEQNVLHPEYQSTTILRADVIYDSDMVEDEAEGGDGKNLGDVVLEGFQVVRRIRRRLMPARKFDRMMEEECLFLQSTRKGKQIAGEESDLNDDEDSGRDGLLLLLPDMKEVSNQGMPYYHPQVSGLAFHYVPPLEVPINPSSTSDPKQQSVPAAPLGILSLEFMSLPTSPLPTPMSEDHRTYRTGLMMMKLFSQVAEGLGSGYQKKVLLDLLAGKEAVQDLYAILKGKYTTDILLPHSPRITFSWLLAEWKEVTDPSKHVFEDLAIAAWLMVVWNGMYGEGKGPPGGFVDVGCGNGLLVYILSQEGYSGYGLDLRARKSWAAYSPSPNLITLSLDIPTLLSQSIPPFPSNSFLIGNHADELTPWIPFLAAATPGSAFLNIPCCCHRLTERFCSNTYVIPASFLASLPSPLHSQFEATADDSTPLPLPPDRLLEPFFAPSILQTGRYFAYQLYIAHMTLLAGYVPEREALRIPSTKNFGFLGRKRIWEGEGMGEEERLEGEQKVREEITKAVESVRSVWKARVPEGRAGEGH